MSTKGDNSTFYNVPWYQASRTVHPAVCGVVQQPDVLSVEMDQSPVPHHLGRTCPYYAFQLKYEEAFAFYHKKICENKINVYTT